MSTTIANFFENFFAHGTPGTLPEKKRVVVRWFASLPRILGVVCVVYYVYTARYAHGYRGGVAQGPASSTAQETGSPYDNRYGSLYVGYKPLGLVQWFVGLFCFR